MTSANAAAPSPNATPVRATVTLTGERELHVERVFNASRERVWEAHTDPTLLAQWWGRGNPVDVERYELERGGHWRFVEHAGGQKHGFEGRFREVTKPERLSMTFEWDGMPGHVIVNTIEFVDMGDGRTKLVSTSQFFTAADRDGMVQSGMESGMNESYVALDRVLAAMP